LEDCATPYETAYQITYRQLAFQTTMGTPAVDEVAIHPPATQVVEAVKEFGQLQMEVVVEDPVPVNDFV